MKKSRIFVAVMLTLALLMMTVAACDSTPVGPVELISISVNPSSKTLKPGDGVRLYVTYNPSNTTNKAVTYASDNIGAATVSSTGEVTAVAIGNAVITVTAADGNKTAQCAIQVTEDGNPADTDTDAQYKAFTFPQFGSEIMPTMAYCPPISGSVLPQVEGGVNRQIMLDFRDSGINVIIGYTESSSEINKLMGYLDEMANPEEYPGNAKRIVYMVNGLSLLGASQSAFNITANEWVAKNESFGGFFFKDEPGQNLFASIGTAMGYLKAYNQANNKKLLGGANLFPIYGVSSQFYGSVSGSSGYTYANYLEDYEAVCNPQLYSYDNYPTANNNNNISSSVKYFENMSVIKQVADRNNAPFWPFIHVSSWGASVRSATQNDVYWQVNTALAYGAKGIQYFTYATPTDSPGIETFSGCMISRDGTKNPQYGYVQNANKVIDFVDQILMKSINEGVLQQNSPPNNADNIPAGDRLYSYYELTGVTGTDRILVGCFNYNGKTALYVVNNSISAAATTTLNFGSDITGFKYQGGIKSAINSANEVSLSLGVAEGVLIELTSARPA